jgi:hypothetical protein
VAGESHVFEQNERPASETPAGRFFRAFQRTLTASRRVPRAGRDKGDRDLVFTGEPGESYDVTDDYHAF